MTVVKTNIDHNIDDLEFKQIIAITVSLIKYQGNEYLDKLKALNAEYEIINHTLLTEKELQTKLIEKS